MRAADHEAGPLLWAACSVRGRLRCRCRVRSLGRRLAGWGGRASPARPLAGGLIDRRSARLRGRDDSQSRSRADGRRGFQQERRSDRLEGAGGRGARALGSRLIGRRSTRTRLRGSEKQLWRIPTMADDGSSLEREWRRGSEARALRSAGVAANIVYAVAERAPPSGSADIIKFMMVYPIIG
jgi:hypothetical protein